MATIGGARAIGRADDLGSIEAGKQADLLVVDLERPQFTPKTDVASTLVSSARGSEVDTVICDGEVVMADDRVPGIDDRYPELLADATAATEGILNRSGLTDLRPPSG
jgi:cytosine/adenosine deaminase-related metal-dependent hydrolase